MSLTGRHEGEQRGDKAYAKAREDECSLVVHAVDRLVHRAVLAAKSLARAPHGHCSRRDQRGTLSICVAEAWVLPNAVIDLPNVVEAVHMRLAQIEMVTKRCKQA